MIESLPSEDRHQIIQQKIKRFILSRGLQAGDALPTEIELARVLRVSRNSLREAIRSLQTLGVVETRHGLGTFVGNFSLDPLADGLMFRALMGGGADLRTARELLEVREVLETGLIARVTLEHTPEHLAELHGLISSMEERARRGQHFRAEDSMFHRTLYRPLGNEFLMQLIDVFWRVLQHVRAELPGSGPDDPVRIARGHRMIVDAIASGDPARASEIMALHFTGMRAWLRNPSRTGNAEQLESKQARNLPGHRLSRFEQ
ncbi:MAG: FadR family transcriptional regulator [Chloroflexota bacterium]|nr:FadR family transcriptional regulator [Chloroflexota bacterium]